MTLALQRFVDGDYAIPSNHDPELSADPTPIEFPEPVEVQPESEEDRDARLFGEWCARRFKDRKLPSGLLIILDAMIAQWRGVPEVAVKAVGAKKKQGS